MRHRGVGTTLSLRHPPWGDLKMPFSLDASLVLGVITGGIYPLMFWVIGRQERTFKAIKKVDDRMDAIEKRTTCLVTLHLQHHKEDRGIIEEACGV